jgi:CMP-N,N'-diacetyllegionaminic acid synthase
MIIVVPARGGSKRIPLKNIVDLAGRPLLAYTLKAAMGAGIANHVYVSTDDERIAKVAKDWGAKVVIRPARLASDGASTESVLLHVLDELQVSEESEDWIMTLPPTSPLRSALTIRGFASHAERAAPAIDCVMSVTENRSDFWHLKPGGGFGRLFPDQARRQQDRPPLFEENSAVYVTRIRSLRRTGSILGVNTLCVPIAPEEGLDINTDSDLQLASALLKAGYSGANGPI